MNNAAALKISENETREAVFHIKGVSKIYQMGEVEVHALKEVDLEIYRGELLVILGPSGGGKSTLLNILGGLDVPTSGEVFYLDHDLTIQDDAALTEFRRDHVGFVFQFYNLIPSLTAYENVELVTDISKNPMRPDEALKLVGLEERINHFPAQMSGGEQQRVAIARAVAKRMKQYALEAGISGFHIHRLRHTFAKIVSESVESMADTQEALGHSNIKTTQVYVKRLSVKKDKYSKTIREAMEQEKAKSE